MASSSIRKGSLRILSLVLSLSYFLWIAVTNNKVTYQLSLSSNVDTDKNEWKLSHNNKTSSKNRSTASSSSSSPVTIEKKKIAVSTPIMNTTTGKEALPVVSDPTSKNTTATEQKNQWVPREMIPKKKKKKGKGGTISMYRYQGKEIRINNTLVDNPSVLHSKLLNVYNIPSDGTNVWDETSSKLPTWMKRYLTWHKHQRTQLLQHPNQTNAVFSSGRFLVMQCLKRDLNCGGTSDRLKPIPWALRTAYYTRRILLIHWDQPGLLEEFLVPPKGGFDWRVPEWLSDQVRTYSK
jgi:thymidylate synthase